MKKLIVGLLISSLGLFSCSSDDDTQEPTVANLTLNIAGLEDLGSNYQYEGWVMVDGTPISTGTFTVNNSGELSQSSFQLSSETLEAATKFILTIEPNPDPDPNPSEQKYIAGDFLGDTASLSTSVAPAIGDFSTVDGNFFLRTPTDEPVGSANNGNDQYGVWFGLPGMPPSPALNLPELPEGWVYEGWVIGDNGPLTTGRFTDVSAMDLNAGLPTSFGGTEQPGPMLPGEDYFNNAPAGETFPLDIRNRMVVISVEPEPDNSPAPFTLKPLVAVAGDQTAPVSYAFDQNLASFPTGNVTR